MAKIKVGDVFITPSNHIKVIQKIVGKDQNGQLLYNCYNIFHAEKKYLDFYPCHCYKQDIKEKIGEFKVVFKGQIPHYTEQFIELRPEYFI